MELHQAQQIYNSRNFQIPLNINDMMLCLNIYNSRNFQIPLNKPARVDLPGDLQ